MKRALGFVAAAALAAAVGVSAAAVRGAAVDHPTLTRAAYVIHFYGQGPGSSCDGD